SGQWYRDRTRGSDHEPTKAGRLSTRMGVIAASGRLRSITCFLSCARLTPLGVFKFSKWKVPPTGGSSARKQAFEGTALGLGAARPCSLLRPSQTHRSLA